tara:strand:- start:211 stop:393 length:183 start_codon:yes stop_codon:yes gene_type:complete
MYKYEIVERLAKAILIGKRVVVVSGKSYNLPEGQGGGTYSQQNTYARLKAKEIVYENIMG